MMVRASLCLVALALGVPAARADPVYVIEQLVVTVTSDPGPDGERVAQVRSGDQLELLEREGDEAHVRLPNGSEGWIKASYVSSEQPMQYRLAERTAEVEKLKQDVTHLESELAAARAAKTTPPAANTPPARAIPVAPTPTPTPTPAPAPAPATAPSPVSEPQSAAPAPMEDSSVFLRTPDQPSRPVWEWVLGTAVVMLLVGFALGWRTLDRRIRSKYGGLRIY
jgi:hypothetical protein